MIGSRTFEDKFAYGFDDPIDTVSYSRAVRISGWLVNIKGQPVHGIRLIARNSLWPRRVARARRKRSRPDVAVEFPDVPDAHASGFLIETQLRSGRNQISIQVQDEQKIWRTFFNTTIKVLPLDLLEKAGFPNVRDHLADKLQHRRAARSTHLSTSASTGRLTESPQFQPRRVMIYGTLRSNLFIREVGELVAAGFTELGCETELLFDQLPERENNDALHIVLTPHEYYNLFLLEQIPRKTARELSANLVLLCTEHPATGWFQQNLRWSCYARAVADINPLGVDSYRAHGIRAHHLPLGYHELLAHSGEQPAREIDLVFLGSLTSRRERFFARHTVFFSQRNCHLRFVPLGFAKTELSRSYLPAAQRNALLANSKILLNVHYSDQRYFEWHRMLVGLANGCCIITENCAGYAPLIPNKHFVMVEHDALIEACQYYLNHPNDCARIAAAGAEFIRTELRQASGCATLLQALERDHDGAERETAGCTIHATPPADPEPAALPKGLHGALLERNSFWNALRKDLLSSNGNSAVPEEPPPPPTALEREHLRENVVAKRAGYMQRRQAQESRLSAGEEVWAIHDNAEFARAPAPQISVLITLYNYAAFIEGCVDAIDRSADLLAVPIEILIIDDASTDDSWTRARRVQNRVTRAIRLVRKRFNTGLADARNVGTRIARAPYIFMMDADNLVTPPALSFLFNTMEREQCAAAYSILCRFRKTPAHPVGLLSHYDWDPEILVQGPYVDAMAMFRRDVLLQLGGYDHTLSEIGWFGWEDYDMWLRFAQQDLAVGFVPNVLCLYRQHETSMINTTNLFARELVGLFQERYQSLANRFAPRDNVFGIKRSDLIEDSDATPPRALP
ncbi:MAG TPA: glycosyltransferase [Chthoniobacterales bacterium]|nr:glycosyltransferase [Chthoniobacterales bacterium]